MSFTHAVIFDFETNGLQKERSVLAMGVLLIDPYFQVKKEIIRYYQPLEGHDGETLRIHRLSHAVIEKLRKAQKARYPLYFLDDREYVRRIFENPGVDFYIAHNIEFDAKFLQHWHGITIPPDKRFCTMKANMYFYGARRFIG